MCPCSDAHRGQSPGRVHCQPLRCQRVDERVGLLAGNVVPRDQQIQALELCGPERLLQEEHHTLLGGGRANAELEEHDTRIAVGGSAWHLAQANRGQITFTSGSPRASSMSLSTPGRRGTPLLSMDT